MAEIVQRIRPRKRSRKGKYRDRKKAQKAALLVVSLLNDGSYGILGRSEPRIVRMKENGRYNCTCGNASSPCSHVLAVQMRLTKEAKQRERLNKRTA